MTMEATNVAGDGMSHVDTNRCATTFTEAIVLDDTITIAATKSEQLDNDQIPIDADNDEHHHHHWFPQHSQEQQQQYDDEEQNHHPTIRSSSSSTSSCATSSTEAMMTTEFRHHHQYDPNHYTTTNHHTNNNNMNHHPRSHTTYFHRQSSELTHVASNRTAMNDFFDNDMNDDDNDGSCYQPKDHNIPKQQQLQPHDRTSNNDTSRSMQPPPPRFNSTAISTQPQLQQQQRRRDNSISNTNDIGSMHHTNSNLRNETTVETMDTTATNVNTPTQQQYFRVVFEGVVAILSSSSSNNNKNSSNDGNHHLRTGQYVSYGEIICGQLLTLPVSSSITTNNNTNHITMVQIHSIPTGGYAMDATTDTTTTTADGFLSTTGTSTTTTTKFDTTMDSIATDDITTTSPDYKRPRGGIIHHNPQQQQSNDEINNRSDCPQCLGYILVEQDGIRIVEPTTLVPHIETGVFQYRVIATTPIPIYTGPDIHAPKTKAQLLPGTVQEVSVRVRNSGGGGSTNGGGDPAVSDVSFLRLSYCRGWIADRKLIRSSSTSTSQTQLTSVVVVQEIAIGDTESRISGDGSITTKSSVMSGIVASTSFAASSSSSIMSIVTTKPLHRHRPPRKRQDAATAIASSKTLYSSNTIRTMDSEKMMILPRHIIDGKLLKKRGTNDPSSNMSILSDDSSHVTNQSNTTKPGTTHVASAPTSPNASFSTNTSTKSVPSSHRHGNTNTCNAAPTTIKYYLMRVVAPRGMKILDAPQFQVNRLIRNGKPNTSHHSSSNRASSSHLVSQIESISRTHNSIFQTMSSRLTTTGKNKSTGSGSVSVFDHNSKSRVLPCGALFESSRRMETTGSYNQGAGLIKLSDNSGWAIVPRQSELDQQYNSYESTMNGRVSTTCNSGERSVKSYEEIGSAVVDTTSQKSVTNSSTERGTEWVRVVARAGVPVSCPPPILPELDNDDAVTSPSSSRESSAIVSSNHLHHSMNSSTNTVYPSNDSDVASSVGSAFLDALFRTPQKKKPTKNEKEPAISNRIHVEKTMVSQVTIPCGMFLEVERSDDSHASTNADREFARLSGGQGWVPLIVADKPTTTVLTCPPVFQYGSIWFRVQSTRGIKVRYGPSHRATSIRSEDGAYFRFECGEFLRASELITSFAANGEPLESFAKLYRNRHVQLHSTCDEYRSLQSLTIEAEWVHIHNDIEFFLEECLTEPRMERHKQGWRYNVVPEDGIAIRKGPSFAAERTGILLFGGESVVINERVTPAGDHMSWLRLKDGQGWIHDHDEHGEQIVIAHSLRRRVMSSRSTSKPETNEIAYNAIISRLFHNDGSQRPTER